MEIMKAEIVDFFSKEKITNVTFNEIMLNDRNQLEEKLKFNMKNIPNINGIDVHEYYICEIYHFYSTYVYADIQIM